MSSKIISLFSGAGGFSYGFASQGLRPVIGAEINLDACNTYTKNIESECCNIDLSITDPNYFKKFLNGEQPFAIIGGPPCQGFSSAGIKKENDPRNLLIFNYLKIVDELKPRWFVFENVEGILTSGGSNDLPSLVNQFIKIGYSLRVEKVNFAGYGVPQTRKRVLIIGNRLGIDFNFPEFSHSYNSGKSKCVNNRKPAPTLLEAIAGLGSPVNNKTDMARYKTEIPENEYDALMRLKNHEREITLHHDNTKKIDAERFSLLTPGQSMKDLPEEFWHDSFKKRANRRVRDGIPTERRGGAPSGIKRLNGNYQSLTITGAACREFINPLFDRPLTIRECARLQTFPDNYQFFGNSASAMQQIANAVPPLAAEVIAAHLKNLDGSLGSGLLKIQSNLKPRVLGYKLTDSLGMSPALKKTDEQLRKFLKD